MRATRPTSLNRRRSAVALVLFVLSLGILQTGCGDEGEAAAETEPRRSSSRIATVPPDARPEQIAVAARSVAARTHYGLFDATDGRCHALHGLGTETVMPIASAFTLWVLDALVREVSAGRAAWDETLPVQAALRSDPSDEVYALPVGTSVSLRRYAELMIPSPTTPRPTISSRASAASASRRPWPRSGYPAPTATPPCFRPPTWLV